MDEQDDTLTCPGGMCVVDPSYCEHDDSYDWSEDEDPSDEQWEDYGEDNSGGIPGGDVPGRRDAFPEPASHTLDKRMGKRRQFNPVALIDSIEFLMMILARAYPGPSAWTQGSNGRQASGEVYV